MNRFLKYLFQVFSLVFWVNFSYAQLSPGELSRAHTHLEGLKNCTQCHVLGEKETTSKCLECHTEIQNLINNNKGYHASSEVEGKNCAGCHSDHHGLDFEMVRFDDETFDHKLAGYELEGKHNKIKCIDCHKKELIQNNISQKKGETYLGLGTECLSCHDDYHQKTLSNNCVSCHNQDAFKPAPGFDHSKTKFQLIGKHQNVDCAKCHKIEEQNGTRFQEFTGVEFANCTDCHEDVHKNKFGNDCRKCHDEFSFTQIKSMSTFNHEKTNYPLRGKHINLDCKKCHKGSYTRPVKHTRCTDCHTDYHENQFAENGQSPDCAECHSVENFTPSNYTIEKHNLSDFILDGSHLASPCFVCHKTEDKWNFANLKTGCIDCHENIHQNYLDEKYMPESDCKTCHSTSVWNEVKFDHNTTDFALLGKHAGLTCRECHFSTDSEENLQQQFVWENQECTNCHNDIHFNQFEENGGNTCESCHTNDNWKPDKFDHNNARFKLDGKHEGLDCVKCHKPNDNLLKTYIIYKFEDISCASCH
ncbi:MAG: cytochrome C [Prolixibacteraceae bacterium]|nr:cytochrome C [Prolixibacteraceae bacterium]MBT6763688.1 cytochrome C [Prolixibacteraceae bacterium]MBT7000995.1 cytochrome C [Prolixibacteraceae bacterium]MBT7393717.1 cytochrome C [Prolixibacteraceae bacterium]